MDWLSFFHALVIPFFGGFALTLGKLIADRRLLSFDEANSIALDMVLLAVGALGAYARNRPVEATIDGGIGDALLGAILLYVRYRRLHLRQTGGAVRPVGGFSGSAELLLGMASIAWTVSAR